MYEVEQHFFFVKFGFALKILYLCSMIKRGYRVKLLIDKRKVAKKRYGYRCYSKFSETLRVPHAYARYA